MTNTDKVTENQSVSKKPAEIKDKFAKQSIPNTYIQKSK